MIWAPNATTSLPGTYEPVYQHTMGNHGSIIPDTRTVQIGVPDTKTYPDNRVISYKYTLWNFLPKNLFEQFRRIANFYFLCMGAISAILPDSPVSAWSTLAPLILVVTITAIKQGYEDYLRHRADNKINSSIVTVVRGGVAQEITCKNVCVGDIVKVAQDGEIPCDMVLLISSHTDSKCYITTANLDGETNLKVVECPPETDLMVEDLPHVSGTISCEHPTVDLYQFFGNFSLSFTQGQSNLASLHSHFNKDSCEMASLHEDSFRERHNRSFVKLQFPAESEHTAPLSTNNLLLRGSRLRNTEYVFGCAVYTGQETKLALNSTLTMNKFSIVERSINLFLFFFFSVMMAEVVVSVVYTFVCEHDKKDWWYIGGESSLTISSFVTCLFVYIVLYYYLIPISLYVTIEFERFCGTFFFEWDAELTVNNQPAICNTSDLNEELGQVKYLFSDKTGTLTENDMKFRRCSVEGSEYYERQGQLLMLPPSGNTLSGIPITSPWPTDLENFLISMALCHTVQTLEELSGKNTPINNDVPQYQSSSPDEKALVEAAARCGVVFLGTQNGYLTLSIHNQIKTYKKLQTLEFTSDRKRMSVVVSDFSGQLWLFCKGADSFLMPLVVSGHREETMRHLNDFSMRGLRTLVFGMRQLDPLEYSKVASSLRSARGLLDLSAREGKLAEVFNSLEHGLHIQGASAVEDRLQERVPETLELLHAAGIKVWVLTGDKVETALNIAYSCGHFKLSTKRLDLIGITEKSQCLKTLQDIRYKISEEWLTHYGLVVDGSTLKLALFHYESLFREVALGCATVLCCRLSPKQKAELVRLVKNSKERPVVAAVGDGANDISMIQEANVGLGIMGKEGRQAVRCSDFALAKFYCLQRAFLVHGQWYYLRLATLVQYFFYKNIVFNTPQVYFSLLNAENPQSLYLSVFLTLYNTIFCASPIMLYALFEQNYPASVLLSRPELYKLQTNNRLMSYTHFVEWMLAGVWHSIVVYFVPIFFLETNSIFLYNSTHLDFVGMGLTILHNVVVVVNLKLLIHSTHWTLLFFLSVALTILTFITFCVIYNLIFITDTEESIYYIYFYLMISPNFWLVSLLSVTLSLLPDIILRTFQNQKFRRPQLPSWLPNRRKGVYNIAAFETFESKA